VTSVGLSLFNYQDDAWSNKLKTVCWFKWKLHGKTPNRKCCVGFYHTVLSSDSDMGTWGGGIFFIQPLLDTGVNILNLLRLMCSSTLSNLQSWKLFIQIFSHILLEMRKLCFLPEQHVAIHSPHSCMIPENFPVELPGTRSVGFDKKTVLRTFSINFIFVVPCVIILGWRIRRDATVRRHLFTAEWLYTFWASIAPVIRRT